MNNPSSWNINKRPAAAIAASLCLCVATACGGGSAKHTPDGGADIEGGSDGGRASGGSKGAGGNSGAGGRKNTGGDQSTADAASDGEAPDEGDCAPGGDPATASLCLKFDPEAVTFKNTSDLDGKGLLVVTVFSVARPTGAADVLTSTIYPATAASGSPTVEVGALPVVRFTGLPEVVYVETRFVDNLAGLESDTGLSYGMFVGGIELADGVRPADGSGKPPLRKVSLNIGRGTSIKQRLTALRKFETTVDLALPAGTRPPDDAEGPLSVGSFNQRMALGAPVFGGAELPCVDLKKGPIHVTGFFYVDGTIPESGTDVYFGGQLDDFGRKMTTPPGALVSADSELLIPEAQTAKVMPGDYAVSIDRVTLNFVIPGYDGFAPYACPDTPPPPPDGGKPPVDPVDSGTNHPIPTDSGTNHPVPTDSGATNPGTPDAGLPAMP